jgi:hypothetical protein
MAKRLQVTLQDTEYREIARAARLRSMSVTEWVRQALDLARRTESSESCSRKFAAIRTAAKHEFPVDDINGMLAEIEQGYVQGKRPRF